jgi:general secretion pathway protein I
LFDTFRQTIDIFKPETGNRIPVTSKHHIGGSYQSTAAGFTLLEVMVAMAIMAIVLVSVYRMHSQTLTMNAAARFYTQAPMLAQSKLAQLEGDSSEIVAGDSGDFGDKFPGYTWRISTDEVSSEALGEIGADLKRIDMTVSFNSDEYVYDVRTYRFMRE